MGCGYSCCSNDKELTERTVNLQTTRFRDQIKAANQELCNLPQSEPLKEPATEYSFIRSRSASPNKSPFRSKIHSNYRIIPKDEYKNMDFGYFLSLDDISSINLSTVIEGVVCCPSDIFELHDNSIYKGEFDISGLPHGRGIQIRPNGNKFIGYFLHGHISGVGRLLTTENILYQGTFITLTTSTRLDESAVLSGDGKEVWPNGVKYEGEFVDGIKSGKGKLQMNGFLYVGEFKDDVFHGEGSMIWKTGKKYTGEWKDGMMHGYGKFVWPNGKVYEGEYVENEKHGNGVIKWPDGRQYDGEWKQGKQHGKGIYMYFDKRKGRHRRCGSEWEEGNRKRWLSPIDLD